MLIQSPLEKLYQWTAQQPDKLFYDNPIKASGCTTLGKTDDEIRRMYVYLRSHDLIYLHKAK